jgi:hypothetical protein
MLIALDIDDTITRHPAFFAFLSQSLIAAGHGVAIVTFRTDRESTSAELDAWGIAYTHLITASLDPDSEDGTDPWKARICKELGVDVLFDDSPEVLRHVSPSILSLMVVDQDRYDLNRLCQK